MPDFLDSLMSIEQDRANGKINEQDCIESKLKVVSKKSKNSNSSKVKRLKRNDITES